MVLIIINPLFSSIFLFHLIKYWFVFLNSLTRVFNLLYRSKTLLLYPHAFFDSGGKKGPAYLCLISISIILLLSIFILEIHVVITFSTLWHVCNCCFIIILAIWHQLLFGFILYKIILGSSLSEETVILKGNLK